MEKVLGLDAAAREDVSKAAVANARNNFSKQSMCEKTLDVYNEVLAEHRGA